LMCTAQGLIGGCAIHYIFTGDNSVSKAFVKFTTQSPNRCFIIL